MCKASAEAFASLFLTSSLFAATIHEGDAAQKSFELTANKQYGDNYETQNNVGVILPKEYEAKEPTDSIYEAHKNYVDIQYIVEGQERVDVSFEAYMELDTPYDTEKDIMFFKNPTESFSRILGADEYIIVLPHELHKPGQKVGENGNVKKIVGKVRV